MVSVDFDFPNLKVVGSRIDQALEIGPTNPYAVTHGVNNTYLRESSDEHKQEMKQRNFTACDSDQRKPAISQLSLPKPVVGSPTHSPNPIISPKQPAQPYTETNTRLPLPAQSRPDTQPTRPKQAVLQQREKSREAAFRGRSSRSLATHPSDVKAGPCL